MIWASRSTNIQDTVTELIAEALPWTISLLLVTTVLTFVIGNLLGAVAAWPRSPTWLRTLATPFVLLQGVPPVLMGILLLFFIAFRLKLLPLGSAYSTGIIPDWQSFTLWMDVIKHQILPALALILGSVGGWVLSMRGMGVTIQGEDYVNFAEHKGLGGTSIFRDYYLRNAMLPQVTGLALALGSVVTSGIVVEGIFGLPGHGHGAERRHPVQRLPGDLRHRPVHHHRGRHADGIGRVALSVARPAHPAYA